uniref:Methionine--tRNA ligase n=2 Tax=Lygus hesperus TaxID=30085 RepID=A0A0A9Y6E1_LYGHE
MCEQRRQENLYLESRLRAVESCSKESMLLHGAAASGAAVALSGLGNRLEILVEALVTAYEISQADLEDVVFHNEAFAQSSASASESSSGKSSPKRIKTGFVTAIINAIKAATLRSTPDTFSDGDLLSAEPEPSGFLKDITCNSSPGDKRHSIASLPSLSDISPSKCSNRESYAASELDLELGGDPLASEGGITNSESLQNLSEAILRRQKEEEESAKEMTVNRSVQTGLIDQVIEVDNLITKLLKVMHIIQCKEKASGSEEEQKVSSKAVVDSLKQQIEALQDELKNSSNSHLQVCTTLRNLMIQDHVLTYYSQ